MLCDMHLPDVMWCMFELIGKNHTDHTEMTHCYNTPKCKHLTVNTKLLPSDVCGSDECFNIQNI